MVAVTQYTVTAERSGRWWSLQCVEVPGALSQVARLDQADQIREAIAFVAGVATESVEIQLRVDLPESVQAHLAAAARLRGEADAARSESAAEVRRAARELASRGISLRDIGTMLDVSHQRAHQLVKG
jgi:hypothetical protein